MFALTSVFASTYINTPLL